MSNKSGSEKRGFTPTGAIHVLIDENEGAGCELLFERSDGAERQDTVHSHTLQRIDIRTVIYLSGRNPMPSAMTSEKRHAVASKRADQNVIRRFAKGRLNRYPLGILEPFKIIQTCAADNADSSLSGPVPISRSFAESQVASSSVVRILSVADVAGDQTSPRWRNGRRSGLKPRGPLNGVWFESHSRHQPKGAPLQC